MKKSLFYILMSATLCCTACDDDSKTSKESNDNKEQHESLCQTECAPDEACVQITYDQGYTCAKKCEIPEQKITACHEEDGTAYTKIVSICGLAKDNQTLVEQPQDDVTWCDSNQCNADKTACYDPVDEKDSLCTDEDGLSICEEGYTCVVVDYYGETTGLCINPQDESCQPASSPKTNCHMNDGQAIYSETECFVGVGPDEGKFVPFTFEEKCLADEICGDKDGKAACVKAEPEEGGKDLGCGANFVASCNADGSTHACIKGNVVDTPWSSSVIGTCHVFADAQYAGYIIEESCTVLEMPQESCFYGIYTKKSCGKAENGKYYWYMSDAYSCPGECNTDGKTCK